MRVTAYAVDMDTFSVLANEARIKLNSAPTRHETAVETAIRLVMERNMYRAALRAINPSECYRVEKLMRGEKA